MAVWEIGVNGVKLVSYVEVLKFMPEAVVETDETDRFRARVPGRRFE